MNKVNDKDLAVRMMKTPKLLNRIIHREPEFIYKFKGISANSVTKHLLKAYADFRVGATTQEKRAYKNSDTILLTFDDYGTKTQVKKLLAILASANIRAMFFLQGDWANKNRDLVRLIAESGHIIGNHTYSHPDLLSLSDGLVIDQINNGPKSSWLRPPRGRYDARIRRLANALGYRICYWTIDSDDWQGVSASQIQDKVLAQLHPGAVILFHIHGLNTLEALPALIQDIKLRGFELSSMDEPLWDGN